MLITDLCEMKNYDLLVRIVLIGDTDVGKTCLLCRYTDDQFLPSCPATLGVDFKTKYIQMKTKRVKLQLWDTAGQEKFDAITKQYYRLAQGVLLIYDISKLSSFQQLERWLRLLHDYSNENVEVTLIGNKNDLEEYRQVDAVQAAQVVENLVTRIILKAESNSREVNKDINTSNGKAVFEIEETSRRDSSHVRCCTVM